MSRWSATPWPRRPPRHSRLSARWSARSPSIRRIAQPPVAPPPVPAAPPRRPNPLEQPLAPGVLMLMEVAVIAPVVSADPRAWTHLPTARSVAAAAAVWVKVVELLTATVRGVTALVVGLGAWPSMAEPLTEVTLPVAPPNPPGRPPPPLAGRDGGVPDPPPAPPPPPNPPPPPPNPPAHVPLVG